MLPSPPASTSSSSVLCPVRANGPIANILRSTIVSLTCSASEGFHRTGADVSAVTVPRHTVEGKAEIATYGLEQAKSNPSFHFRTVEAGFYNTNVLGGLNIYKDDEGVWKFPAPIDMQTCSPLPTIDIPKDYGLWVRAVIEQDEVRNDPKPVLVSGEDVHVLDLLKQLGEAAGIEIQAESVTVEKFAEVLKGSPQHIIDDLSENWPYMAEFGCESRGLTKIVPGPY